MTKGKGAMASLTGPWNAVHGPGRPKDGQLVAMLACGRWRPLNRFLWSCGDQGPVARPNLLAKASARLVFPVPGGPLMGPFLGREPIVTAVLFGKVALGALLSLGTPLSSSGQSILLRIIDSLERANSQGLDVEFYWIPAHHGIEGNELADKLAKEATGCKQRHGRRGKLITVDTDDAAATPDFLRHLISAARSELNRQTQERWEHDWEHETTGRATFTLTPTPSSTVLQLHDSLHKVLSSTIVQMRTGKIGLRQFLYERKVPDITDTLCECGNGNQTVRHVLLACPRFNSLRAATWKDGDGRRERLDLREILTKPKLAKKAARFMILTRLLGQYGAISGGRNTLRHALSSFRFIGQTGVRGPAGRTFAYHLDCIADGY
ncbi:predicted protein [Histoplasma mississippiense (nom. inval.)]|uniref:predicted protein n=1 Tax=Ajellomyces capsulatus (strain NAm1 / WU24) TaxID=2059318 RepID=UPI000157D501|nr:predicted protein [Histoplasma mississippiense (nom. inval.)]EDN05278.1 predicted protein [Histoplasma mississippiense (nom. inval.)]